MTPFFIFLSTVCFQASSGYTNVWHPGYSNKGDAQIGASFENCVVEARVSRVNKKILTWEKTLCEFREQHRFVNMWTALYRFQIISQDEYFLYKDAWGEICIDCRKRRNKKVEEVTTYIESED